MAGRLAYPIRKSDPIFSYLLQIGLFFTRIGVPLCKKLRKFKVLKADMLFLSSNIGVLCLFSPFGFFITYLGQDSPALAASESWGNPSFSPTPWIFLLYARMIAITHFRKYCILLITVIWVVSAPRRKNWRNSFRIIPKPPAWHIDYCTDLCQYWSEK